MSVPTDDPDFLTRLSQSLGSGLNSPLMGLAAGLLQAGGPSRTPVSLGQALGQGLQTGQQFQAQGLQNAMQQLQLGQRMQVLRAMQNGGGISDPNTLANLAALGGDYSQASQIRASTGDRPMTDQEINQYYGGKIPGLSYWYNDYTHKPSTTGEKAVQDVQDYDPKTGLTTHHLKNLLTGKDLFPQTNGIANGPQTANPGDETVNTPDGSQVIIPKMFVNQVHSIASYNQGMPASTSRNPILAANMATWVKAVNPDWSQGNFAAKNKVLSSASGGADAKQLDSFNTIQSHLGTLKQTLDALNNGDIQSANKLSNWAGVQFGKSPQSNAQVVSTLVSRELGKVLASGGQMTDADKAEANSAINTFMSKGQYTQALDYINKLIGGKTGSIVQRFKAANLSDNDIKSRFTPDAWNAYQNFENSQQQPTNVQNNTQGWSIQKVP